MPRETLATIAQAMADSSLPTALFLGAGSSIPSGGPSGDALSEALRQRFLPEEKPRSFVQICTRIDALLSRQPLISAIREILSPLEPAEAVRELPGFRFSRIFTTNFDRIIEKSYGLKGIDLPCVRSNRDINFDEKQYVTTLYKVHGCVSEDTVDGAPQGMIVTEDDYTNFRNYRQTCMNALEGSLLTGNVVFVGYSLLDDNIREYVDFALNVSRRHSGQGRVFIVQFEQDEIAATIWEKRGASVAFGDLDGLLADMVAARASMQNRSLLNPFSTEPKFKIATALAAINIEDELNKNSSVHKMLSGSPVQYADIRDGFNFNRSIVETVLLQHRIGRMARNYVIVGPSGSGKTSLGRILLYKFHVERGYVCFEHKTHRAIDVESWKELDKDLHANGKMGVLLIDEMNNFQFNINQLSDYIQNEGTGALTLVVLAHPTIWKIRTKSVSLTKRATILDASALDNSEIKSIVDTIDRNGAIKAQLSPKVRTKSRNDLIDIISRKARSDLFVSLKYLLDNRSLDEIILKEYDDLKKILKEKMENLMINLRTTKRTPRLMFIEWFVSSRRPVVTCIVK